MLQIIVERKLCSFIKWILCEWRSLGKLFSDFGGRGKFNAVKPYNCLILSITNKNQPAMEVKFYLNGTLCFPRTASKNHKKCASKMQNCTYFEQISKTPLKSAFLRARFAILQYPPPPGAKSAGKIRIMHEKEVVYRPPPCPSMYVN